MKFKTLSLVFLVSVFTNPVKANFNFNSRCIDAYKAIFDFRLGDAASIIKEEKQQDPQNGITIMLDNYVDYYSLVASENKADYEKLKDKRSERISALEDNDQNSPFYLFAQAEVYLQWSFLKAKFGDYFSSALDAKKAGGLLKENSEKYPDFLPNQLNEALVNVIFGSIPANFKGITRFLGMSGNAQTGIKQLEQLRVELPKTKYSYFNDEVIFFICGFDIDIQHDVNGYNKLIPYLSGMGENSLLKVYMQGYVASRTGHNDDAIAFMEARPKSSGYIQFPAVDRLLGNAKLNRLDSAAPVELMDYVKEFRGTSFIKDSYLKLAYYYLLQNDDEKYKYFINLVKSKGYTFDEKDKQALSEANDEKPDIDLLKARFYFDGSYYNKALAQLANKDVNGFKLLRDKIEYYYRLGRIYEKTEKLNDAVLNYQRAINLGKTTTYYYSANAAVSIGRIFEGRKDFKRAADYYNQALDMKNHGYGIDNDAKEGLRRIGQ